METMQSEFIYDDNPPEMKPDQVDVWRVIHRHRGRDSAILARDIADVTSISERTVRNIIHELRFDFHKPIGSNTGSPAGYYIAENEDELMKASYPFKSFGLKQLKMAYRMLDITRSEFVAQITIDLTKELAEEVES